MSTATAPASKRGMMSLGAHLGELRRRLARAAGGFLLGGVAGWFLSGMVLDAIREPILEVARSQHRMAQLNFSGITAAFDLRLQIALMLGAVLSSPIWLYQVWAFFVPAMTRASSGTRSVSSRARCRFSSPAARPAGS